MRESSGQELGRWLLHSYSCEHRGFRLVDIFIVAINEK
jgi:hypothetical protein